MQSLISDSFDYNGKLADRSSTGGWVSAALISVVELSERLSTISTLVNLVTYLVGTMHLPSSTATTAATNFGGTPVFLCIFGGFIADSFLGRYWTIFIFTLISALGTCSLAIITGIPQLHPPACNPALSKNCIEANSLQKGVFYFALYLYALGVGGVKSTVSGFGTDQFDQNDNKEKAQMTKFFQRFYLTINIGTVLAVTVIVYIQDKVGRKWGYGVCSAVMFLAFLVFLSGSKRYRYKKCNGSPLIQVLQVLVAATRKRKAVVPPSVSFLYEVEDSNQETRIFHTTRFRCLDKAAIITNEDNAANEATNPNPWRLCTVTRVEEVKMVIRLLPIWATTIMFWTVYSQMTSTSVQQASTMDRSLGNVEVPPASFNVFLYGSIVVILSIYDGLIMPNVKLSKGSRGLTSLQKMGLGNFIAIMAMVSAALVERRRLSVIKDNRVTTSSTLPMSAFWLVPQFAFVGIGNGFTYSGQLDFFITQSPKGMKAMATGLFLTTIAFGFYFSSVLVLIVKKVTGRNGGHKWMADRINDGRLDLFYWLLVVLSSLNFVLFLVISRSYKVNDGENSQKVNGEVEIPPNDV